MDVSAILSTSANAYAVAEAFDVPGLGQTVAAAPVVVSAERLAFEVLLDAVPTLTAPALPVSSAPVDVAALAVAAVPSSPTAPSDSDAAAAVTPAAQPPALLTRLSDLSRVGVRDYLAQHPDAVADLLAAPPAASTVASWWAHETSQTRSNLAAVAPELIGNLEGLPYEVRAATNERYLDATIAALGSKIDTVGRAAADDLRTRLHMLQQIADAVKTGSDGQTRSLVTLDVTGAGRAVIVIGDLATADYVTYMVPGMFYSVDSEIVSWTNAAAELATDQQQWLDRLAPNQSSTVATVSWIGYQTPSLVDVTSLDLARKGSVELAESLQGLATVRGDGERPYLSVLTHSYGSTVALLALEDAALGTDAVTVDSLAMVGSPGSDAKSVAELNVRDGNVWVADAALDPVSHAGVFGSQPLSPSYGANLFGVTGATDPLTGAELASSLGHVDYFTAGSESFRNMALISIGREGYVLDPDGRTGAQARALAR